MQALLNKLINLLKWPTAVYMLLILPAIFKSVDYFNFTNMKFLTFGGGILGYIFIRLASDNNARTSMCTVIHELTHALFAFITFHKVRKISLAEDNSGKMVFEGDGNWLIIIAPYFFPLLVFFYMIFLAVWLAYLPYNIILNIILGYLTGMHIDTVVSQIHEGQTDLPKVSYLFCATFLPGANLLVIGIILACNSLGFKGITIYINLINSLFIQIYKNVLNMLF